MNGREVTVGQLSKVRCQLLAASRARQGSFFGEIAVLYDMPRTATALRRTSLAGDRSPGAHTDRGDRLGAKPARYRVPTLRRGQAFEAKTCSGERIWSR